MTLQLPQGSGRAGDPFSAAFAAWSEQVTRSWQGQLPWPQVPAIAGGGADPLAMFRAMMDLQQDLMRGWFDLAVLPFAALGGVPASPPKATPKKSEAPTREKVVPLTPAPVAKPEPAAKAEPVGKPEPPAPPKTVAQLAPDTAVRATPPTSPVPATARAAETPVEPTLPMALPQPTAVKVPAAKPRTAKAAPEVPAIDPTGVFSDDAVEKTQPPVLKAADGAPDDLQAIKGIGAKLTQLLNDLGIYHYRQIAAWTPGEIAWINAKIDFKGRVQREKWVSQARELAKKG